MFFSFFSTTDILDLPLLTSTKTISSGSFKSKPLKTMKSTGLLINPYYSGISMLVIIALWSEKPVLTILMSLVVMSGETKI